MSIKKIAKSIFQSTDLKNERKIVVMAQAILESGHGSSTLAKDHHNYFGIKWRKNRMTGFAEPVHYCDHANECEDYCKFGSEKACVVGYVQFVKSGPYDLDGISSPEDYIDALVEGGYAADPAYKSKLTTLLPVALQFLVDAGADEDDFDFEDQDSQSPSGPKLKLAIVVGHTSTAPGAYAKAPIDSHEFPYNSVIAQKMEELADSYDINCTVIFRQKGLSYKQQIQKAYKEVDTFGSDLSVELHFNSAENSSAKGTETLSSGTTRSLEFARAAQDEVHELVNRSDRGVKIRKKSERGGLSLHSGQAPAILVEPFFGSNKKDCQRADVIGAEKFARAYLKAAQTYGLARGIL
jgi:N-acetylmuramoyl-L-alanine amidase